MDWNLKAASWGSTESTQELFPDIIEVGGGSSSLGSNEVKGDFLSWFEALAGEQSIEYWTGSKWVEGQDSRLKGGLIAPCVYEEASRLQ